MKNTPRAVRSQFLLSVVVVALVAVGLSRFFLLEGHSPSDVVATHWNRDGQADGAGKVSDLHFILSAMALAPAVVSIGLVVFRVPLFGRPFLLPSLSGLVTWLATLTTCMSWSVSSLNRGVIRWQDAAPIPGTHVAVVVFVPMIAAMMAALSANHLWPGANPSPPLAPTMHLESDERAFWLGRANASQWLWFGLPLSLSISWAAAKLTGTVPALLLLAFGIIVTDAFSTIRVVVDRQGLRIAYGRLGLIRQHISLSKVQGARAREIRPLDEGGWGYRGSLTLFRKAAVVVRRGEAIELTLSKGRRFIVTVDDAATGAALLNGMVQEQSRLPTLSTGLAP